MSSPAFGAGEEDDEACASGQRQVCKDWKGEKRDHPGEEEEGEWDQTYNAKKRRKKRQEVENRTS